MLDDLQDNYLSSHKIVVRSYRDNVVDDIPAFLGEVGGIVSLVDGSVIQLVDADYVCGRSHLCQAIFQAFKAFDEGQNFAKDLGLEICVRLSAQRQISEALKLLGVKNRGNVTVICVDTTSEQLDLVEDLLSVRDDSLLDEYDVALVADAYSLSGLRVVDELNEKIALLSIKN